MGNLPLLFLLLLLISGVAADTPSVELCEERVASLDYSRFLSTSLGGELSCIDSTPRKRCCAKVLTLFGRDGSAPLCLCNVDFYSAWMVVLPGLVGVNPDTYVDMLTFCKVPIQGQPTCTRTERVPDDGPRVQGQILSTLTALLTGRHQGRISELVPWITSQRQPEASSKEASTVKTDESAEPLQISNGHDSDTSELVEASPLCASKQQASECEPSPTSPPEKAAVPAQGTEKCKSLVRIARSTPELTAFVQILDVARLASTLQDGFMGTLFAPSNSAFEQLLEELGGLPFNSLIDPENEEILVQILKTHVVPGRQVGLDITKNSYKVPTLLEKGQDLLITVKNGDISVAASGNNLSVPVKSTITSCSGVLHILDGVLLPAEEINQSG